MKVGSKRHRKKAEKGDKEGRKTQWNASFSPDSAKNRKKMGMKSGGLVGKNEKLGLKGREREREYE